MTTVTEYLAQAKKRLAVTCDKRNILKREYDPLFFNFEAACDDLSKLIRICEIQREGLERYCSMTAKTKMDDGSFAPLDWSLTPAGVAIQLADNIARER